MTFWSEVPAARARELAADIATWAWVATSSTATGPGIRAWKSSTTPLDSAYTSIAPAASPTHDANRRSRLRRTQTASAATTAKSGTVAELTKGGWLGTRRSATLR